MTPTRFTRGTVLVNCCVPLTLLAWDAWHGQLGANPVNFAIRTTGLLSLLFLTLTLAVTPASRLTGYGWLGSFRRMLGLCAFFHALLHFALFFGLDRNGSARSTFTEVYKRPYLMVGMFALVLMAPLAATSTDRMIRRLGGRRWKRLHRLTYPIAAAGALHFYMLVKADTRRPLAFAGVIGVLLGYRALARFRRQLASDRTSSSSRGYDEPAFAPKYWKGNLRVARVFQETPDVRTFRLVAPEGGRLPFRHLPGQYLNVALLVDGRRVNRSYTIASPPTRADYCEITVKREENGLASRHLHDSVREGDLLSISAPAGRFTFTGVEAKGIVLIGGGVGITPLMAKIRHLTDVGWPGEMHLVLSVRTEPDIVFREELDDLAQRFPNLHVLVTLTREAAANWPRERGRISAALLERTVPQIASERVHICGPTSMTTEVVEILTGLGVASDKIHVESFTRAAGNTALASQDGSVSTVLPDDAALEDRDGSTVSASVTFARAGKSGTVRSGQTVLEVAEELGVEIPYDCRAGICGQCKTRLLSGHVEMEVDDALVAADRARGLILSCQARCLDDVVVDA
ncbi:MAG: ferric reductase-like transmembrane domain-containing protein [Isosphaeraceae bacterium]